jgi:hypothetical protein
MSKLEVNAVEPQCGTNLTLGASGDTIIIPSGATISNQGTAAGFGPTGAVSWDTTKKTTGFTAVTGVGYFADTTSAAFTITLPSSPSAGAVVGIADYANTFATNNLTVGRNGSNIGGVATNAVLSTNGLSVTFVYVDATQGWIVTDSGNRSDLPTAQFVAATGGTICTSGDFKIHTFTGPGTFTVTNAGNPLGSTTVDYMVVAGGASGGNAKAYGGTAAGGGGAGGFRQSFPNPATGGFPITVQGYPITVGGGGPANTSPAPVGGTGNNGTPSIFSTITSTGGGGGGGAPGPAGTGLNGGSGGGSSCAFSGGTGNTPPTSPPQGNPGGTHPGGGGGGGASTAGSGPTGTGGSGVTTSISGSSLIYGGGGGGGQAGPCNPRSPTGPAPGGPGGGGAGGSGTDCTPGTPGTPGTINTGGGGGGGSVNNCSNSGAGGSGIVIIRYKFQ